MIENINIYLIIVAALLGFYLLVMLYIKYGYRTSKFTPVSSGIPDIEQEPLNIPLIYEPNVYETSDTRMQFPLLPPVNPMVRNRIIKNVIPANPDLYTSQTYESSDYILDTPPTEDTNQLLMTNGENQMISVPLQINYPYTEQLRSQDILITPYNKVKYGNC